MLDDFPYSWTEGTATSMEELAFDSINDYLQYATLYFSDPTMSFFNRTDYGITIYSNSILLQYLYRHLPPGNSINFMRSFYTANYTKKIQFDSTLLATVAGYGTSWTNQLHEFHKASFFTGADADTDRFIADARLFMMPPAAARVNKNTIVRSVESNGALHIRVRPLEFTSDTLTVDFTGTPSQSSILAGNGWACSILLRKAASKIFLPVAIDSALRGSVSLLSWQSCDDAVIVITNGDPASDRTVRLSFGDTNCVSFGDMRCPDSVDTNRTILEKPVIFPNPVSLSRHQGTVHVKGDAITTVSIRSVYGSEVWKQKVNIGDISGKITWECKTRSGLHVSPGTYMVLAAQHNTTTGTTTTTRHKLLVIP
jgi:hypothetical protein